MVAMDDYEDEEPEDWSWTEDGLKGHEQRQAELKMRYGLKAQGQINFPYDGPRGDDDSDDSDVKDINPHRLDNSLGYTREISDSETEMMETMGFPDLESIQNWEDSSPDY